MLVSVTVTCSHHCHEWHTRDTWQVSAQERCIKPHVSSTLYFTCAVFQKSVQLFEGEFDLVRSDAQQVNWNIGSENHWETLHVLSLCALVWRAEEWGIIRDEIIQKSFYCLHLVGTLCPDFSLKSLCSPLFFNFQASTFFNPNHQRYKSLCELRLSVAWARIYTPGKNQFLKIILLWSCIQLLLIALDGKLLKSGAGPWSKLHCKYWCGSIGSVSQLSAIFARLNILFVWTWRMVIIRPG